MSTITNITTLLNVVGKTDYYTRKGVLGSLEYILASSSISKAAKAIPKFERDPVTNEVVNIEAFLNEERNLRITNKVLARRKPGGEYAEAALETTHDGDVATAPGTYTELRDELGSLLGYRSMILDLLSTFVNDDRHEKSLEGTLKFMIERDVPETNDTINFINEFSRRYEELSEFWTEADWVADAIKAKATRRGQLLAHGEAAVQYLEGLDAIPGVLPDWMEDRLFEKAIQKLNEKRTKIGRDRSRPQFASKSDDMLSQMFVIEKAIEELGGDVVRNAPAPRAYVAPTQAAPTQAAPTQAAPVDINQQLMLMVSQLAQSVQTLQHQVQAQPTRAGTVHGSEARTSGPVYIYRP